MDRAIVYNGEELIETDILNGNKFAMIGLAKLAEMALGTGPLAGGFPCTPGTGLAVAIGAGQFYLQAQADLTAFSSLGTDAHTIVKQGVLLDPISLACPAPGTAGQSINYLIEVTYQELDTGSTVLPFYNASNPSIPYSGPAGAGTPSYTIRAGRCQFQAKAGVAAATGSQVTPSPDAGYSGLYVVTVANGAVSITTGNITLAAGAPFIQSNLGTLIQVNAGNPNGNVAGSAAVAGRSAPSLVWDVTNSILWACTTTGTSGTAVWTEIGASASWPAWCGTSTGTANAQAITTPAFLQAFPTGTVVGWLVGAALTNTGAATVTVGTFGTFALRKDGPTGPIALTGGEIVAGNMVSARFDGTNLHLTATEMGTAALANASSNTGTVAAVSGATVVGKLAQFSDTGGTVVNGPAPSSSTATVAAVSGATVIGNIPVFSDVAGTVVDSGAAPGSLAGSAESLWYRLGLSM